MVTATKPELGVFTDFASAIHNRFQFLAQNELFITDPVDLMGSYLSAFPDGTNPLFRTRTEYDCSCCRNFIKYLGPVVAIIDGKIETVWGNLDLEYPFNIVANALDQIVSQLPIKGVYRTNIKSYGSKPNYDNEIVGKRWEHFHEIVPARFVTDMPLDEAGTINTTVQVFRRGLDELTVDAFDTVLDLIETNSIYRGEQFETQVRAFRKLLVDYKNSANPSLFAWENSKNPAARLRNTAIGTLLIDLSEGKDLDRSVREYERMVAPQNYKRTTAIITPVMVDKALDNLRSLGLEGAVHRRMAKLSDISVNNVLFVDNTVVSVMKDHLRDILMGATKKPTTDIKHAQKISLDTFLNDILPSSTSIDMLVENYHKGNFVTLTAPNDENTGKLFQWGNDFAWSYNGEVTDSIKERVKTAGGRTDAIMRVSLGWFNYDDLDIHVFEPNGNHISYSNKSGKLDVDMNVSATSRNAVENVAWTGTVPDGDYKVHVHNFTKRENVDVGFVLEVEFGGNISQFYYDTAVNNRQDLHCLTLTVKNGVLINTKPVINMRSTATSDNIWGIDTNTLVPIDTVMLSPNHWDGEQTGNRHLFLFPKGCKNPDPVRGFYNEFLRSELNPHRKVFETLASQIKCESVNDQLSGIGFSTTQRASVKLIVRKNDSAKAYEIQF